MTDRYLLALGIGHVLGDFYFQGEKLAKEKDESFIGVLKHSIEYLVVVMIVMIPIISFDMVLAALYLSIAHFVVDAVKYVLIKRKKIKKSGMIFIMDQTVHIASIVILTFIMFCWNFEIVDFKIVSEIQTAFGLDMLMAAKWILVLLIIHIPSNMLIHSILNGYKPQEKNELIMVDQRFGRRIGTIERLIMLLLIAMDQYAAIGFVLTAKSIARYDKIAKDEKFAEYYLLGTLLSTACAVICKMVILS